MFEHKRDYEIKQNGDTIFYAHKKAIARKPLRIDIHQDDQTILASVSDKTLTENATLHLGDPGNDDRADWTKLKSESFRGSKYKFVADGRSYLWERTHNDDDLDGGFQRWSNKDFKLVEEASNHVLVVYRYNAAMLKHHVQATIDYYVELGKELESLSLAAILGIEQAINSDEALNAVQRAGY